jgi:catechol 2,3-dioxygenase-like lactoylglutathione lyase family enzyme
MIDHISLAVSDLVRSKHFYDAALLPLGVTPVGASENACSYALDGNDDFSIHAVAHGEEVRPARQYHFAFAAANRGAVERFYRAAVEAGGIGDGPPGLRPQYHPGYYAAFVLDPDGHRIEAVFHDRRNG